MVAVTQLRRPGQLEVPFPFQTVEAFEDDKHLTIGPIIRDIERRSDQLQHYMLYDDMDSDIRRWYVL